MQLSFEHALIANDLNDLKWRRELEVREMTD
jgi:hypothetical protein